MKSLYHCKVCGKKMGFGEAMMYQEVCPKCVKKKWTNMFVRLRD